MIKPRKGQMMERVGGTLVKIEKVWYRTSPVGTWRVTWREEGKVKGGRAWYKNGWWREYTE